MKDITKTVQHVNFWWLKEPGNEQHMEALIQASLGMKAIPGVSDVRVGPRVGMADSFNVDPYDLGLIVSFESQEALDIYHPHELHQHTIALSLKYSAKNEYFYFFG